MWQLKGETLGGLVPPLTFERGKPSKVARCYFVQQIVNKKWTVLEGGRVLCLS